MNTDDPFIRRNILLAAAELIEEKGSREVRFDDVAERANVDVVTIENLFDDRTQLVAEVQMANYFVRVEPIHLGLSRIEEAVDDDDEVTFWSSVEENLVMSWTSGQLEKKWGIINQLHDVWSDPFTQSHFCDLLDIQFQRWIAVVEGAKDRGWIGDDIDAKAITTVFWSASVGQVITAGSTSLDLSPVVVRDFFVNLVRGRNQPAVR